MALNRSRIGKAIIDTSALHDAEKQLFESLVNIFNVARQEILFSALLAEQREGKSENPRRVYESGFSLLSERSERMAGSSEGDTLSTEHESGHEAGEKANKIESPEFGRGVERIDASEPKELKTDAERTAAPEVVGRGADTTFGASANELERNEKKAQDVDTAAVRMLCTVEQFVGPNLEIYGPFEENEIVQLPQIVCNALVNRGKAVVIEKAENEASKNNNEVLPLL